MRSVAAEDGCTRSMAAAADDQFGRSVEWSFHQLRGSVSELIPSALARYFGSSALRAEER